MATNLSTQFLDIIQEVAANSFNDAFVFITQGLPQTAI